MHGSPIPSCSSGCAGTNGLGQDWNGRLGEPFLNAASWLSADVGSTADVGPAFRQGSNFSHSSQKLEAIQSAEMMTGRSPIRKSITHTQARDQRDQREKRTQWMYLLSSQLFAISYIQVVVPNLHENSFHKPVERNRFVLLSAVYPFDVCQIHSDLRKLSNKTMIHSTQKYQGQYSVNNEVWGNPDVADITCKCHPSENLHLDSTRSM